MKILVNDIAASEGGVMTILKQFYRYIRENDTDNEWFFFLSDHYVKETERIHVHCFPEIKASHARKLLFDCFTGKKEMEAIQPDVVFSLQNSVTFGVACPQVIYIQQSLPFQTMKRYSFWKKDERFLAKVQYLIGGFIRISAKRADHVIVQTQWMKKAVADSVHIPESKILVAMPDPSLYHERSGSFDSGRFFYPVVLNTSYKNVDLLVKACERLNQRGIYDFILRLTLPEHTLRHTNIQCIGTLSREQMQTEYSAGTMIFPSYIETVGLPLLEARSCKTMILASDTPFSTECLRGYPNARFFDPFSAEKLADEMQRIIQGDFQLSEKDDSFDCRGEWGSVLSLLKSYKAKE